MNKKQDFNSYIKLNEEYNNFIITRQINGEQYMFRSGFLILNSTEDIYIKIQKFNYSIMEQELNEYLQICQDESYPKELYFYIKNSIQYFIPVYGNYSSYFIKEKDIHILSDFDFSKITEINFFENAKEKVYLKIKCEKPAMLKHAFYDFEYHSYEKYKVFNSGQRYIIEKEMASKKFYLNETLVGSIIPIKFSLLGCKKDSSISVHLDDNSYLVH